MINPDRLADVIDDAADVLERGGRCHYRFADGNGAHCLNGALAVAAGGRVESNAVHGGDIATELDARRAIGAHLFDHPEAFLSDQARRDSAHHPTSATMLFSDSTPLDEAGNARVLDVMRATAKCLRS